MANNFGFTGSLKILPISQANIFRLQKQLDKIGNIDIKLNIPQIASKAKGLEKISIVTKDVNKSTKALTSNFGLLEKKVVSLNNKTNTLAKTLSKVAKAKISIGFKAPNTNTIKSFEKLLQKLAGSVSSIRNLAGVFSSLNKTLGRLSSNLFTVNSQLSLFRRLSSIKSRTVTINTNHVNTTINKIKGSTSTTGTSSTSIAQAATVSTAAITQPVNKANKSVQQLNTNLSTSSQNMRQLGIESASTFRRFGLFTAFIGITRSFTSNIRQAVSSAFELESQFIKIGQVSQRSFAETKSLRQEILTLSSSYGTAATEVAEVALTLTQAGLSAQDVTKALQAVVKTDLSPTFNNIAETGEAAIAIINQFGTTTSDLTGQFDAINVASARFAVESSDIVAAVRKSGGAFKTAGGSLNELIALYTTIRSTTRESPESIANGLRTITTRLQRSRTIQKLQDLLNVNLRDQQGEFIGPVKAFEAIGKALEGVSQNSEVFSKVTEALGGVYQVSRVTPLLTQFGTVQKVLDATSTSAGSVSKDVERAQESLVLQARQLRNEFFELITLITQDETIRRMASTFLDLARAINQAAKALVPLSSFLAAGVTGFAAGKIAPFIGGLTAKLVNPSVRKNEGGFLPGRGPNKDTVPALLTKGEYVLKRSAVDRIGVPTLNAINRGYNDGGVVGFNSGGLVNVPKNLTSLALLTAGVTTAINAYEGFSDEADKTETNLNKLNDALNVASVQILGFSAIATLLGKDLNSLFPSKKGGGNARSIPRSRGRSGLTLPELTEQRSINTRARELRKERIKLQNQNSFSPIGQGLVDRNKAEIRRQLVIQNTSFTDPVKQQAAAARARELAGQNKQLRSTGDIQNVQRRVNEQRIQQISQQQVGLTSASTSTLQKNRLSLPQLIFNAPNSVAKGFSNSKIGKPITGALRGAGNFLQKGGGLPLIAASLANTVAQTVLSEENFNKVAPVTKGVSLAAQGALLGSFVGPIGTAVGAITGLALGFATESEGFNKVLSDLSAGLLEFDSALRRTSTSALSASEKEFSNLEKQAQQERDNNKRVTSGNLTARLASNASLRGRLSGFDSRTRDEGLDVLGGRSSQIVKDFKDLSQVKGFDIKSFTSVLPELRAAFRESGETLEDYIKSLKAQAAIIRENNAANIDYIQGLRQRQNLDTATQSALAASSGAFRRSGSITGTLQQADVTSIFARGQAGTLDSVGLNQLTGLIRFFANQGGDRDIASRAFNQAQIIDKLPQAIEQALQTGGPEDIDANLSRILSQQGLVGVTLSKDFARLQQLVTKTTEDREGIVDKFDTDNIDAFIASFKSGSVDLDAVSGFFSAIQENNSRLQSALDVRVSLEQQLSESLNRLTDILFESQDDFNRFNIVDPNNPTRAISQASSRQGQRLNDILRFQPQLQGANAQQLASSIISARQSQQQISGQGIQTPQDVQRFTQLQTKIDAATKALEFLRDNTDKAAAIRGKLNDLEEKQTSGRNILERFAVGGNAERIEIQRQLEAANIVAAGGNLQNVPQQDRAAVLQIIKELRGEVSKNTALQRTLGPSANPFFVPIGQTIQGQQSFNQLQQNNQQRFQAGQQLANVNQSQVNNQSQNISLILSQFQQTLQTIMSQAKNQNTVPQQVIHQGNFNHTVNVNINGGRVWQEIQPGVQKMVVDTVNNALTGLEKENPGIKTPTVNIPAKLPSSEGSSSKPNYFKLGGF